MGILESLWDIIVLFFWSFVFIAALFAFILVVIDLFRDKKLNGWAKAVWVVFLVFVPLLTSLIYLIARGAGMPDRINDEARRQREANEGYIRDVAAISPADEILKAKTLLDSGAISAEDFAVLKARALASSSV
ncbi:SHOCT domain-containing protein [Microbacterium sp. A82]|uniref:SHOCT domain-containing protein n=1 Tax=unclassified Microbacterium TaxID=2609290 RepID=UPI003F2DAA3A